MEVCIENIKSAGPTACGYLVTIASKVHRDGAFCNEFTSAVYLSAKMCIFPNLKGQLQLDIRLNCPNVGEWRFNVRCTRIFYSTFTEDNTERSSDKKDVQKQIFT